MDDELDRSFAFSARPNSLSRISNQLMGLDSSGCSFYLSTQRLSLNLSVPILFLCVWGCIKNFSQELRAKTEFSKLFLKTCRLVYRQSIIAEWTGR